MTFDNQTVWPRGRCSVLLFIVVLPWLTHTGNLAAGPSVDPGLFKEGTTALAEGLPEVAAHRLRAFLESDPAPAERREATLALVHALVAVPDGAGALTVLDDAYPLPPTAAEAADSALAFWRAQTLASLERWPEAHGFYRQAAEIPGTDPTLAAQARFGQAESLLAQANSNGVDARLQTEATAIFKTLYDDPGVGTLARLRCAESALDSHHLKEASRALGDLTPGGGPSSADKNGHVLAKEHDYLVGRLRLAQRQPAAAQQIFAAALAHPEGLNARLLADNYWGWARACLDEDRPDLAQRALENLLTRYPRQPYLETVFSWLETLYDRVAKPDLDELRVWAEDGDEPDRQACARLALAHAEARAGYAESAEVILTDLSTFLAVDSARPQSLLNRHALHTRALLDLASLRLNDGRNAEARAALAQARRIAENGHRWRTGIETLEAQLSLADNDSAGASERFTALANRLGTGAAAEAAAFDAALAALRSGDAERFASVREAFGTRFPHSPLTAEFPLEDGLALAAQTAPADLVGRRRAADSLHAFLHDHPGHPRAGEARVSLAELAFAQRVPDFPAARRELAAPGLRRISNDQTAGPAEDASVHDRADYLAVWLADAPGSAPGDEQAVTLAKKFLDERPDSPLAAEARMKLGEIYFARGDYPDAQTQLELLEKNSPNSPLAESALYLAGRAAASAMSPVGIDQAVRLFSKVARRNGPFRLPAQLRLAEVMLSKADNARDARTLYESVLGSTNGPAPLKEPELDARCTALSGRGQTLLTLAAGDPALYKEASRTFDELAVATPGASLRWRRQAFTLKGQVLKETGDTEGALAAYDDALNAAPDPAAGGEGSAPEWTWFYRAGNDAAALLESQSQWTAAIAIYKKLAAADGPMKNEFETRLARRRLEHFIWED